MSLLTKYETLVELVKALRAYTWTPATTPDEGRDHPLYPPKQRCDITPLWNAIEAACKGIPTYELKDRINPKYIESLLAENERLKAELAQYRDAPVVGWQWLNTGTYRKNIKNAALYRDWQPLIVKPGECDER